MIEGICVIKGNVSLTMAQYHSDIKIKKIVLKNHSAFCNQVVYVLCLYWAQISGERLQDHWSSCFVIVIDLFVLYYFI